MQAAHIMGEIGDNPEGMDRMANLTAMIPEMQQRLQEQQEEIQVIRQQNQAYKGEEGRNRVLFPPLPPPGQNRCTRCTRSLDA